MYKIIWWLQISLRVNCSITISIKILINTNSNLLKITKFSHIETILSQQKGNLSQLSVE